jgi:hypothetical protein
VLLGPLIVLLGPKIVRMRLVTVAALLQARGLPSEVPEAVDVRCRHRRPRVQASSPWARQGDA